MAIPQYNVEELIENIKRRCSVPTSQMTYTNADFAALANDELQGEVVPLIMSTREEYFVTYVDRLTTASGQIDIPEDAVGSKLRAVHYVQQANPLVVANLPLLNLDTIAGVGPSTLQTFAGFYVQGDKLMLWPNNSVAPNSTIRLYYCKRTLVLADQSNYGQVTSVDPNTNTVVLSFVPSAWTTGTKLNSVGSRPPFELTNAELTVVTASNPSIILDSVEGIEVGDYISEMGFSAVPQVPIEAHPYLAQLTAIKCLEGLGDRAGMEAAQAKADILKTALLIMISQRVDGSVKKIVNPTGGLRIGSGIWRRGGF